MSRDIVPQRPVEITIAGGQEELAGIRQGKVELYDMSLRAQIPTENRGSYLIYQILRGEPDALIVSPNGGVAVEFYGKLVKNLRSPVSGFTGEESNPHRTGDTREDTERFWLLNNPEFRKELKAKGWLIFPETSELPEYEQIRAGLTPVEGLRAREFELGDFITALRLMTGQERDYSPNIQDLAELNRFGNRVYAVGDHRNLLMPVEYKVPTGTLYLQLGNVSDSLGNKFKDTLSRNAVLIPGEKLVGSDRKIITEYAESKGMKLSSNEIKNVSYNTQFLLADRDRNQIVAVPDTNRVLEQASDLGAFIENVFRERKQAAQSLEVRRLNARRARLGLSVKNS